MSMLKISSLKVCHAAPVQYNLIKWTKGVCLPLFVQDGETPLLLTSFHGHLDVCKMLIESSASVNAVEKVLLTLSRPGFFGAPVARGQILPPLENDV